MHPTDQTMSISVLDQQREAANQLKAEWRNGRSPDAAAAVEQLGGGALHKSVVLDLAYEEYCLRRETNAEIDADEFLQKFPRIARSLRQQICIHDALSARGVLGDPEDLPEWPVVGDIVAGFLLAEELGRGSFGRVFRAHELRLRERQVVVKLTRHGLHEAQLLAKVPHPGVVPVYSVATDDEWGLTALCMPFISRATLQDVLEVLHADRNRPPMWAAAIPAAAQSVICRDDCIAPSADNDVPVARGTFSDAVCVFGELVADALRETHAKGIFHRDLKPSNILVNHLGRPLLIDFNLSAEPLQEVPLGGTLPYMAPEQLQAFLDGMAGITPDTEVDATADLFSLGVCLFELLYGVHPFAPIPMDLSNCELGNYLLERQALGPRRVPDREHLIDRRLKGILAHCLEFHPARRPVSAEELCSAFRSTMSLRNRVYRFIRIHPKFARLSVVSAAGSVVLGAAWLCSLPRETDLLKQSVDAAVHHGDFADAIPSLNRLLENTPDDPDLLTLRGNAYLKTDRFRDALPDLEKAYSKLPTADLATRIAWCDIQLGYYSVAARWYQQTLNTFEETAVVHNNLGYTLTLDGAFSKAVEHYTRALELSPEMPTARLNRADAFFQQSLRNGRPTPRQALHDLQLSRSGRMATSDFFLLQCRICCTLAEPDETLFLDALRVCVESGVPRSLLESDALMNKMMALPAAQELLQQAAAEEAPFSRSVRLIPPM